MDVVTTKVEVLPRNPTLDGLRGAAVITVIVIHGIMATYTMRTHLFDRLFNEFIRIVGPAGVDCFFVLSGYLITTILDRTRSAAGPIRTFYGRRFFRIAPLYFAYLLLVPALFSWAGPEAVGTASSRIWDWLFLTNIVMTQKAPAQFGFLFGHLWSLAIEEQFYILWPLVVILVPRRMLIRVCAVLVGVSVVLRVAFAVSDLAHYGWLLMPSRLDGLMGGAIIAFYSVDDPDGLRRGARAILIPVTLLALLYMFGQAFGFRYMPIDVRDSFSNHVTARRAEIIALPFIAGLFFSCVVAIAVTGKAFPDLLRAHWLRDTGRYSYGMYLLHPLILVSLFAITPRRYSIGGFDFPYQIAWILVLLIASRTAGRLTWHGFEKQVLKVAPSYRFSSSRG